MSTTPRKPKKRAIKYGNVDVPPETFEEKNIKARVNAWIDSDILQWLRLEASKHPGMGYQTLMNQKLRELMEGSSRLDQIMSSPLWREIMHRVLDTIELAEQELIQKGQRGKKQA